MVAVVVLLVSAFINTRARIAQYEFERQAMTSRLHQLKTETAQLKLDIALQNNAAQIAQVAQQENMAYPTADRVQYIQLAVAPGASNSQVASAPQRSWMGQAGHLLISSLDNIFQRFGHGPGAPAYAQD
jgi:hypothetical protein